MMTLYGIANCDTVKKARAWLAAQSVEVVFHDFKQSGVPADSLARWVEHVGWEPLVNRRGTTWRALGADAQAQIVDATTAQALMRQQPSVIKRPVVVWPDGAVTVGFDAHAWTQRLAQVQ